MAILKMNELNQLSKGTVLFRKKDHLRCIGALMKGCVRIQSGGFYRIAKKGAILAAADLFYNQYSGDYIVEEDALFYAFPVSSTGMLDSFLGNNAQYRGIIVHSMAVELSGLLDEREGLLKLAADMYGHFGQDMGKEAPEGLFDLDCDGYKVANYQEYAEVLREIHQKYFQNSKNMAFYQAGEIADVIRDVLESSREIVKYLDDIYEKETGNHLFGERERDVVGRRQLADKFRVALKAKNEAAREKKREQEEEEERIIPAEYVMTALKNSLQQILKFAQLKEEKQKAVMADIQAFVDEKDRMSTQDDVRKLKKQITGYFFELYEKCIFRWFEDKNIPLAVKLFLNYGYLDERLLDEQQILFLYEMANMKYNDLPCPIYTMPEWLQQIYLGGKEPSRNSFEQDYRDWLREEKRIGNINDKQERELLEDGRRKVKFEISNMFTSNNKIVNGKLSTYVPILYKDEIYGHLERLYLTKQRLCDAITELEKMDFTIFQREVLYVNPQLKIDKEYVLKHVYPDVIICPVYGVASSMWQEITGKKRDTPGRFIFPAIAETEVEKLVTKAFGRFHWEYCRCEQGAAWNNIQYRSLTSEYMDYIQYYRKNRELTEEKREKIKTQILKARNNSREVFLIDYEQWIYYESKAAMKLNKVARQILATYCPLNKEYRESLKANATFAEAMIYHEKNFGEKKREWETRIKRRETKGLEVPEEFYEAYNYYANS